MSQKNGEFDIDEVRSQLGTFHAVLAELHNKVIEDHQERIICSGFSDYEAAPLPAFLERAIGKLDKKSYKIGFAGGFSGGKSTLINSILSEPGLLAAEAGECTMSITTVTSPVEGGNDHVEVFYYTKENACKNLAGNNRYATFFQPHAAMIMGEFDEEKFVKVVKDICHELDNDTDKNNRKKKPELEEFLHFLDAVEDRLGTTFIDSLQNADTYLTTDKNNKGLGHLLLIEQVHLFRKNPLFVEKGIEIVDLPGTDSTNVRQKELTHNYLQQADVVILVIEPKGFKMADVDISEELGKHNNEIRNKMFVVMNKFDTLDAGDIARDSIKKLWGQVSEEFRRLQLSSDRIYLTSAKRVELTSCKDLGIISDAEKSDLESLIQNSRNKLQALDKGIEDDNPRLYNLMESVYTDGGIEHLRNNLVFYLENNIQRERMKEIFIDLEKVFKASKRLLDSEKPTIERLKANQRGYHRQLVDFVEKTQVHFMEQVRLIEQGLNKAAVNFMKKAKKGIREEIDNFRKFPFEKIKSRLPVATPLNIKMEAINMCKIHFSDMFAQKIQDTMVKPVVDRLNSQIGESKITPILKHFSDQLPQDFSGDLEQIMVNFNQNIHEITLLRAREETWKLQETDMRPAGFETAWTPAIEKTFKDDIVKSFTDILLTRADVLGHVIPRYYKTLMEELIGRFEKLLDDLSEAVKNVEKVTIPVGLLTGEEETDEKQKEMKLLEYFHMLETAEEANDNLEETLVEVDI
jgi:GTPase SAR1 family protein